MRVGKNKGSHGKTGLTTWILIAIVAVAIFEMYAAFVVIAILIALPVFLIVEHVKKNKEEKTEKEYYNSINLDLLNSDSRNVRQNNLMQGKAVGDSVSLMVGENTGYDYERFCASVLYDNDFRDIEITPASGDFGADIIATDEDGIKWVVQCKYYNGKVGPKAVQEVVSAMAHYKAQRACVMTNSQLTENAKQLARENRVMICEYLGKNCDFGLIMDELRYN